MFQSSRGEQMGKAFELGHLLATDSTEGATGSVTETALSRFGFTYGPRARRRWYLWE